MEIRDKIKKLFGQKQFYRAKIVDMKIIDCYKNGKYATSYEEICVKIIDHRWINNINGTIFLFRKPAPQDSEYTFRFYEEISIDIKLWTKLL
jgi:hypothetical protein